MSIRDEVANEFMDDYMYAMVIDLNDIEYKEVIVQAVA